MVYYFFPILIWKKLKISNWVNLYKFYNFCNQFQMEFLNRLLSFNSPGLSMAANYFSTESWRLNSWSLGRGKCLVNADLRYFCDESVRQPDLQSRSKVDERFWSEGRLGVKTPPEWGDHSSVFRKWPHNPRLMCWISQGLNV